MYLKWILSVSLFVILNTMIASASLAQNYPEKTVRFILPFPPGGSADSITRDLADRLQKKTNNFFVVENKPGAAANLGTGYVVKAPNDGYTILVGVTGALTINPTLYPNLGYDPRVDLAPVTMLAEAPVVVVASRQSGIDSLKELVAKAKAKPGALTYATNGVGTSHHLAAELFKYQAKIYLLNIPYTGTPGALQDIAGGRIDVGFLDLTASLPLIKAGRIVALATTGVRRSGVLSDVPTIRESGYPDYEAVTWISLMAPKGTDDQIVRKLNQLVNEVINEDSFRMIVAAKGMDAVGSTPGALGELLEKETAKWRNVIRRANIKIQ